MLPIGHKLYMLERPSSAASPKATPISLLSPNKKTVLPLLINTTLVMHSRFRFTKRRYANQSVVSLNSNLQAQVWSLLMFLMQNINKASPHTFSGILLVRQLGLDSLEKLTPEKKCMASLKSIMDLISSPDTKYNNA